MREATKSLERTFVRLHDRRGRQKLGLILLEGEKLVRLALEVGLELEAVLVSSEARDEHPELAELPQAFVARPDVLARAGATVTPPPVLAAARTPRPPALPQPEAGNGLVLLDGLQNPGNLGSILRTAEAFGLEGAAVTRGTVDRFAPKVLRGSMGAALRLPVLELDDATEWLEARLAEAWRVLLAMPGDGLDASTLDRVDVPFVLVLGSEARGIAPALALPGTEPITLRTGGSVGSLGVAAAGAILIHLLKRHGSR